MAPEQILRRTDRARKHQRRGSVQRGASSFSGPRTLHLLDACAWRTSARAGFNAGALATRPRRPIMQLAEVDTAPDTIEATLTYLLDTGETPSTYTARPG